MQVVQSIQDVTHSVSDAQGQGHSIGLVPTQGCLHIGHQSLITAAKDRGDFVVVSIFVNPLQFRQTAYEAYPRDLDQDLKLAAESGADLVFAPHIDEMYQHAPSLGWLFDLQDGQALERHQTEFRIDRPADQPEFEYVRVPNRLTHRMDGIHHPWHFDGVATVVRKLFDAIKPNNAYFGLKDVQQLAILRSMNQWMGSMLTIIPVPVIRDDDGLATSSRLVMLTKPQREIAVEVVRAINETAIQIKDSNITASQAETDFKASIKNIGTGQDQLELDAYAYTDSTTLDPLDQYDENAVLYIAYLINGIRLAETISMSEINADDGN
jgi:pantoate--beta-alanine ligase